MQEVGNSTQKEKVQVKCLKFEFSAPRQILFPHNCTLRLLLEKNTSPLNWKIICRNLGYHFYGMHLTKTQLYGPRLLKDTQT